MILLLNFSVFLHWQLECQEEMLTLCLCLPPSLTSAPLTRSPPPSPSRSLHHCLRGSTTLYRSCWTGFPMNMHGRRGAHSYSPCLWVSPLLLGLTRRPRSGAGGRQRDGGIGLQMVETCVSSALWGSVSISERWSCSPEYRSSICQVHVGPLMQKIQRKCMLRNSDHDRQWHFTQPGKRNAIVIQSS